MSDTINSGHISSLKVLKLKIKSYNLNNKKSHKIRFKKNKKSTIFLSILVSQEHKTMTVFPIFFFPCLFSCWVINTVYGWRQF